MSFGFENVNTKSGVNYLRTPGLHKGGKFIELKYDASENWEYVDIVVEDANGAVLRDRSFGPDIKKVYPRQLWENGQPGRMETPEEAYQRNQSELSEKIFYIALAASGKTEAELKAAVGTATDLKSFVDKVNAVMPPANETLPINFLTIWRNSDSKQRSNMAIPDGIRWVETAVKDSNGNIQSTIRLKAWQEQNQLKEKYPYNGDSRSEETILGDNTKPEGGDLPF